jgi:hypothetical protein
MSSRPSAAVLVPHSFVQQRAFVGAFMRRCARSAFLLVLCRRCSRQWSSKRWAQHSTAVRPCVPVATLSAPWWRKSLSAHAPTGRMSIACVEHELLVHSTAQPAHANTIGVLKRRQVSVAKAGLVASLPARTAILAAANPAGGHYDRGKTLQASNTAESPTQQARGPCLHSCVRFTSMSAPAAPALAGKCS